MRITPKVKSNRQLWIETLESGKYTQTRSSHLRHHGRYCCLGVYCKVTTWDNANFENECLTEDAKVSLGMTKKQEMQAIDMNDGYSPLKNSFLNKEIGKSTFKEIAAHFRKIWKME